MKKKIKDLTKAEVKRYFCDRYKECKLCPLNIYDNAVCKFSLYYNNTNDEEEVELLDDDEIVVYKSCYEALIRERDEYREKYRLALKEAHKFESSDKETQEKLEKTTEIYQEMKLKFITSGCLIKECNEMLIEKDKQIENLRHSLREAEDELNATIKENKEKLETQRINIISLNKDINEKNNYIERLREDRDKLIKLNEELEEKLSSSCD